MSFQKIQRRPTLAEEVSGQIKESILGGEYPAGKALPTEPELAEQFGVSRAVIRDAVRMLAAQGLLDVQHGRGMFVTASLADWFAESLYMTLRKEGASVWDVEQFEELFYPDVCYLAAQNITQEQAAQLQRETEEYLRVLEEFNHWYADRKEPPAEGSQLEADLRASRRRVFEIIFTASGNKLLRILGMSTLTLRNFRYIPEQETTEDEADNRSMLEIEKTFFRTLIEKISSGKAQEAATLARRAYHHSQEMIACLEKTPIGEKPTIPRETVISAFEEAENQEHGSE